MKTLLIVFAVLLLLLTLLSTFGGSIRQAEPFYAPPQNASGNQEYYYDYPKMPPNEFYDNQSPEMPVNENYAPPAMGVATPSGPPMIPHVSEEFTGPTTPSLGPNGTPEPFEEEDAPLYASF